MIVESVTVTGRNMDVGEALTTRVEQEMEELSRKYFGRLVTCRVVFTKHPRGHAFTCRTQVIVGTRMHYTSEAEFDNPTTCFNQAFEHLAKQLRREKRARHEDKPNGHAKERVLNELSKPEQINGSHVPVMNEEGELLSYMDGEREEVSRAVETLYGVDHG